jgi:hypothetical protein
MVPGTREHRRLALILVAAFVGTAATAFLAGDSDGKPSAFRGVVVARADLPAGFLPAARPAAAPDDSVWLPLMAPNRFGTTAPSGSLLRVAAGGAVRQVPMPAANMYPASIVVDELGVVWFRLVKGDGVRPAVDAAPALSDSRDEIGWLAADGLVHELPLTGKRPSIRFMAVAAGGGVWYTAYTDTGEVFGHASADGRVSQYPLQRSWTDLVGIAQGPAGSVWLVDGVACTVWREVPGSGPATKPLPLSPSARYLAGCGPLLPTQGGGVRLPVAGRRVATLDAAGGPRGTLALPTVVGDTGQIVDVAAGNAEDLWLLTAHQPGPGVRYTTPVLLRLGADGVHRYTPLRPVPPPTGLRGNDLVDALRAFAEYQPDAVVVTPRGVVWLSSATSMDELG